MNGEAPDREKIIDEILQLIRKMKIPSYRKSARSTDNMRWLNRNLGTYNTDHPNYNRVMELLSKIV